LDPERGARRRKNNEIKFGNQLYMVVCPVVSLLAAPRGAARVRVAGPDHAVLGRKSGAPPRRRTRVSDH
jgi:hypothetical protein